LRIEDIPSTQSYVLRHLSADVTARVTARKDGAMLYKSHNATEQAVRDETAAILSDPAYVSALHRGARFERTADILKATVIDLAARNAELTDATREAGRMVKHVRNVLTRQAESEEFSREYAANMPKTGATREDLASDPYGRALQTAIGARK
jgi:hypothetical protein